MKNETRISLSEFTKLKCANRLKNQVVIFEACGNEMAYFDKNCKEMKIMCGCGGSEYYCSPCIRLLKHEVKYHNIKNVIIVDTLSPVIERKNESI